MMMEIKTNKDIILTYTLHRDFSDFAIVKKDKKWVSVESLLPLLDLNKIRADAISQDECFHNMTEFIVKLRKELKEQ
jgi:hypothetical protein